jgi:hypothetical protein
MNAPPTPAEAAWEISARAMHLCEFRSGLTDEIDFEVWAATYGYEVDELRAAIQLVGAPLGPPQ